MMPRFLIFFLTLLVYQSDASRPQDYFTTVEPTGIPYAVVIEEPFLNDILPEAEDEIGLFDGELCAGAAEIKEFPAAISVCRFDSGVDLAGFERVKTILYRIWDESERLEIGAQGAIIDGQSNGTLGFSPYTHVSINAYTTPTLACFPYALNFSTDIGETVYASLKLLQYWSGRPGN